MNIAKQLIAFFFSIVISAAAVAHSNHGPKGPIAQDQAEAKVESVINRLVTQKKLDSSWKEAQRVAVSQQENAKGKVWIIQYTNNVISEEATKSLYVVLDEMDNTLSATHSEP